MFPESDEINYYKYKCPEPDEIISYLDSEKPPAWRDGHYPWQFMFEILHELGDYNGFYYENPNIGQIYDRSDTDPEIRGSCLPTSFEMAVEHLFPTPKYSHSFSNTLPRSTTGKVLYSGTNNTLGELILGGIRYPINQVMLHDIFRCNPKRMMSIINSSSMGIKVASSINLDSVDCRHEFGIAENPYHNIDLLSLEKLLRFSITGKSKHDDEGDNEFYIKIYRTFKLRPLSLLQTTIFSSFLSTKELPGPVFESKDIRTWNIVRSLLQGRTPILTYRFPRPTLYFKNNSDGFPIVTSYKYDEKYCYLNNDGNEDEGFNPDEWPEMQGHAIVAIGLKKMKDELYFLINDPGPSLKIDIREGEFELLHPEDPKLACGSQYWISESNLLEGRMSIDGLFEISREIKVLEESADIHQVSELRMGLKEKKKPIKRIVIL